MTANAWDVIRAACHQDVDLQRALARAKSADELVAIANQLGFDIALDDLPGTSALTGELSDAELESASGGTIGMGITNVECMPTGWVFCGRVH